LAILRIPSALPSTLRLLPQQSPSLIPYTTLFRSGQASIPTAAKTAPPPAAPAGARWRECPWRKSPSARRPPLPNPSRPGTGARRSEEHTSELQSRENLVCRLLLEQKKGVYSVCG